MMYLLQLEEVGVDIIGARFIIDGLQVFRAERDSCDWISKITRSLDVVDEVADIVCD